MRNLKKVKEINYWFGDGYDYMNLIKDKGFTPVSSLWERPYYIVFQNRETWKIRTYCEWDIYEYEL